MYLKIIEQRNLPSCNICLLGQQITIIEMSVHLQRVTIGYKAVRGFVIIYHFSCRNKLI